MSPELIDIVNRWVETGHLSSEHLAVLRPIYLRDIGADLNCKLCGSNVSDIKHHFSYKLKQLNLLTVKSIRKFIILGAGFLMLPGSSQTIVNDGQESEDRKVLTDDLAKEILEEYPDYSKLIGINPAWAAANPDQSEATDEEGQEDDTPDTSELQAAHDLLAEENKKLKTDNSVLKGQLTRATNELTRLKTPAAPAATVPAAAITGAGRLPITLGGVNEPTGTTEAVTGEGGAPSEGKTGAAGSADQSGESTPGESKGNPAANATAEVVTGSQDQ